MNYITIELVHHTSKNERRIDKVDIKTWIETLTICLNF